MSEEKKVVPVEITVVRDDVKMPFKAGDSLNDNDVLLNSTDKPVRVSSLLNEGSDQYQIATLQPGQMVEVDWIKDEDVELVPVEGIEIALTDVIEADSADVVLYEESSFMSLIGAGVGGSGLLAAAGIGVAALAASGGGNGGTSPTEDPPVEEPPVEDPPVEDPPVVEPPVEDPPVEDPPVVEPPVEDPPPPVTTITEMRSGVAGLLLDTSDAAQSSTQGGEIEPVGAGVSEVSGQLASATQEIGSQIESGAEGTPFPAEISGLLVDVVGGSRSVETTEPDVPPTDATGITGLLIDAGNALENAASTTPLADLGVSGNDIVGSGEGSTVPAPMGLADLTGTIGEALVGNSPQDAPLLGELVTLLGQVIGSTGETPSEDGMGMEMPLDPTQLPAGEGGVPMEADLTPITSNFPSEFDPVLAQIPA